MKIRTSRQWLTQLAALSSNIETINLTECKDADADLGVDALFLANDDVHTRFIANAIEKLCSSEASSLKEAKKLIRDIMSIKTYGAFSELAAYDWLLRNGLKITTQVYMHARDILGINGAHLDGKIDGFGTYFDVKGFGFPGHLAARLKKRLESELPGEVVLIENTWDVSVYQFEDLLNNPASLLQTLNQQRSAHIGDLFIRLEKPSPVIISRRTVSPYRLAKENATYPFLRANQLTRDSPFILIFVVHPWFNQSAISHDFHGVDGAFTRALARRAFMQLTNDSSALNAICKKVGNTVTFSDAAKALSAIIFLNAWPKDAPLELDLPPVRSSIYLNPRASHPLSGVQLDLLRLDDPHIRIDDFVDDDY